jgi:hypothetical protein
MKWTLGALVVVLTGLILFEAWNFAVEWPHWTWLGAAVLLVLFMMVIGQSITGRPLGILISELNVMSLARFQTVLWTVIVISAYLVIAIARIRNPDKLRAISSAEKSADAPSIASPSPMPKMTTAPDPLNIELNKELLSLVGITATALVGASLIASTKKSQTVSDSAATTTAKEMLQTNNVPDSIKPALVTSELSTKASASQTNLSVEQKAANVKANAEAVIANTATVKDELQKNAQGTLYKNPRITDASFTDLFEGNEVGNTAHVDLGKVQMFYFTLIVALAYAVDLWNVLQNDALLYAPKFSFPVFSAGMVALLGISNAGYLANKGVDHTQKT